MFWSKNVIAKPVVHAVVKYTIYTAQYKKDWCCVKRMEKSVHSWSPVICSDSKLLLQCWIEGPTVIKRDSVLEEPKHDQKQICVQGEHTHAQFTHMHVRFGCGFLWYRSYDLKHCSAVSRVYIILSGLFHSYSLIRPHVYSCKVEGVAGYRGIFNHCPFQRFKHRNTGLSLVLQVYVIWPPVLFIIACYLRNHSMFFNTKEPETPLLWRGGQSDAWITTQYRDILMNSSQKGPRTQKVHSTWWILRLRSLLVAYAAEFYIQWLDVSLQNAPLTFYFLWKDQVFSNTVTRLVY